MTRMFGRSVLRAVKQVDRVVGHLAANRRVLVDARTPMNLAVMRPVWIKLVADPSVDVSFTSEQLDTVGVALERDGLRHKLMPRDAAKWLRIDLAMTADAWNDAPLYRCRHRINFFHGVAGKYDLDRPERLGGNAFSRFDRMAFINADRLERYVAAGVLPRERAVLVGFPKLDGLVNGEWPAAVVRAELGLDPTAATVLYAPTFSTASSLHTVGESIIAAILDSGRSAIVKLHDRAMVPDPKYTDGIDWPRRLTARFGQRPGFALARAADSGPFLSAADVLVTDHSTVGFEFALLDRPIIVLDTPALKQAARIDDDKWNLLRSMADVVPDAGSFRPALESAFADPSGHRATRQRAHDLFANAGSATERALAVVYELLEV